VPGGGRVCAQRVERQCELATGSQSWLGAASPSLCLLSLLPRHCAGWERANAPGAARKAGKGQARWARATAGSVSAMRTACGRDQPICMPGRGACATQLHTLNFTHAASMPHAPCRQQDRPDRRPSTQWAQTLWRCA